MKHCTGVPGHISPHSAEESEFSASSYNPDGLQYACKTCQRTYNRLRRKRLRAALDFDIDVAAGTPEVSPTVVPTIEPAPPSKLNQLIQLARKAPIKFSDLCDRLDLSPKRAAELVTAARVAGALLHIEHDHVAVRVPEAIAVVQPTVIEPTVGERQLVGVISDLHFGSRYCLQAQLQDCVRYLVASGVTEILCPGDLLDGNYVKHGLFELSHVGASEQIRALLEGLPQAPGLTYHFITGNHDLTFTEQNGVDIGRAIVDAATGAGRHDLRFYGNRGAFLRIRGVVVHLWHPGGGSAYARSYKLQKKLESYAPGEKPSILLAGHWHQYCALFERGVHALSCPTFQGGGSAFGRSLTGSPNLGGLLLEWELTAHGTVRNFSHELRSYFEREQPQDTRSPNDIR